jgi:hypothetical protein
MISDWRNSGSVPVPDRNVSRIPGGAVGAKPESRTSRDPQCVNVSDTSPRSKAPQSTSAVENRAKGADNVNQPNAVQVPSASSVDRERIQLTGDASHFIVTAENSNVQTRETSEPRDGAPDDNPPISRPSVVGTDSAVVDSGVAVRSTAVKERTFATSGANDAAATSAADNSDAAAAAVTGAAPCENMSAVVPATFTEMTGDETSHAQTTNAWCDRAVRAAPFTMASQFVSLFSSDVDVGGANSDEETYDGGENAPAAAAAAQSTSPKSPVGSSSSSAQYAARRGMQHMLKQIQDASERIQERICSRDFGSRRRLPSVPVDATTAHDSDAVTSSHSAKSDGSGGGVVGGSGAETRLDYRPVRSVLEELPRISGRNLRTRTKSPSSATRPILAATSPKNTSSGSRSGPVEVRNEEEHNKYASPDLTSAERTSQSAEMVARNVGGQMVLVESQECAERRGSADGESPQRLTVDPPSQRESINKTEFSTDGGPGSVSASKPVSQKQRPDSEEQCKLDNGVRIETNGHPITLLPVGATSTCAEVVPRTDSLLCNVETTNFNSYSKPQSYSQVTVTVAADDVNLFGSAKPSKSLTSMSTVIGASVSGTTACNVLQLESVSNSQSPLSAVCRADGRIKDEQAAVSSLTEKNGSTKSTGGDMDKSEKLVHSAVELRSDSSVNDGTFESRLEKQDLYRLFCRASSVDGCDRRKSSDRLSAVGPSDDVNGHIRLNSSLTAQASFDKGYVNSGRDGTVPDVHQAREDQRSPRTVGDVDVLPLSARSDSQASASSSDRSDRRNVICTYSSSSGPIRALPLTPSETDVNRLVRSSSVTDVGQPVKTSAEEQGSLSSFQMPTGKHHVKTHSHFPRPPPGPVSPSALVSAQAR